MFLVMAAENMTCFHGQKGVMEFELTGDRILVDIAKKVCISMEKHGHDKENKYVLRNIKEM